MLLAIETSFDETAVAVYDLKKEKLISNIISSQMAEHKSYGGVVPEIASREHTKNLEGVVNEALLKADIALSDLKYVSATVGPGLSGALLIGASAASGYSLGLDIPLIQVHHMYGHINAVWIEHGVNAESFPMVILLVSGAHTLILVANSFYDIRIVSTTIDDAAGEAYDKVSRMLGLGYPGGPVVDKISNEYSIDRDKDLYKFTIPIAKDDTKFSFSGLKTAVLNVVNSSDFNLENSEDVESICYSFQKCVVETCIKKVSSFTKKYDAKTVAIGGGVAANSGLRNGLIEYFRSTSVKVLLPSIGMCTDNAGMIAAAGAKLIGSKYEIAPGALIEQAVFPRWNLEEYLKQAF